MKRYECFSYYQNVLEKRAILTAHTFEGACTDFWNNVMRENQAGSSQARLLYQTPDMLNTWRLDDQGFTVIIKCLDNDPPVVKTPIKPSAPFKIDFGYEQEDPLDAWINNYLAA